MDYGLVREHSSRLNTFAGRTWGAKSRGIGPLSTMSHGHEVTVKEGSLAAKCGTAGREFKAD